MEQQILKQSIEYNSVIGDVFGKIGVSPYRNSFEILWLKKGASLLKESINKLLKIKSWTKAEKTFLKKMNEIIIPRLKNTIITITMEETGEILTLSIEALIERDQLVQGEILEEDNLDTFKEVLFLLEANARLLKLIKYKLERSEIEDKDFFYVKDISNSLIKSYLFLSRNIKKDSIKESMLHIKAIWRWYNPLSKIEV